MDLTFTIKPICDEGVGVVSEPAVTFNKPRSMRLDWHLYLIVIR